MATVIRRETRKRGFFGWLFLLGDYPLKASKRRGTRNLGENVFKLG